MKNLLLLPVIFTLLYWVSYTHADMDKEQVVELIRRSDEVRSPNKPFRYTVTVLEYKENRQQPDNKQILDVSMRFIKPVNGLKADARSLARFIYPPRDRGKLLLSNWFELWFFSPELRRPIPISPLQRLLGQISNGDVIVTNFEYAYHGTLLNEDSCGDKLCYKILLVRKSPGNTWPKIIYWVEKDAENRPFKASYYSLDDKLMKEVFYQNYQLILGRHRPTRIIVQDARQRKGFSVMEYSNIRLETQPEYWFTREYLQRGRK